MTAAQVAALATALTVAVMAGQWLLLNGQSRIERVRLMTELATRWSGLRDEWDLSLLAVEPGSSQLQTGAQTLFDYLERLSDARQASERARHAAVLSTRVARISKTALEHYGPEDHLEDDFLAEFRSALDENFELWLPIVTRERIARADLAPYAAARREVLRFFAWLSGLLLRGDLDVRHVYEVVGAEVARRGGTIRRLFEAEACNF